MVVEQPVIGVTMGDPASIGPEIMLKAFGADYQYACRPVVIGDVRVLQQTADHLQIECEFHVIEQVSQAKDAPGVVNVLNMNNADPAAFRPGDVSGLAGAASAQYVIHAAKLAMAGDIAAMVTGPINKESINLGGYHYAGHTELLAEITEAPRVSMMLVSSKLRVLHVSTHVSLREACERVRRDRVLEVIRLADRAVRSLGIENPHVAVAGLNPHASEGGLFGHEEQQEIIPAIEQAVEEGINATGPWPGDTVFLQATQGRFDVVVAMYHDQGHIPMKLLGFDEGVNVSIGLPIIRTSVDHGTAFDIVGRNIAREDSLVAAMHVAIQMVQANQK